MKQSAFHHFKKTGFMPIINIDPELWFDSGNYKQDQMQTVSAELFETPASQEVHEKPVILIADDSRVVRASLQKILRKDFTVIETKDGEEAWEKLTEAPLVHVVFSDLSMPNLNGFGLLDRIRQSTNPNIRETPFVVITGNEDNEKIRSNALKCGATDLIIKPFQPIEITARAKACANNHQKMIDAAARFQHESIIDPVTGLANLHYFTQRARKDLAFALRHKNELALALLEIDQFEKIAAQNSNAVTNRILNATAQLVKKQARTEDTAAYFGEGRFALLLPATNDIRAKYQGKRILNGIKKLALSNGDKITASLGIAAPDIKPGILVRDLLVIAQRRLNNALTAGGDRIIKKDSSALNSVPVLPGETPDSHSTEPADPVSGSYLNASILFPPDTSDLLDSNSETRGQLEEEVENLRTEVEILRMRAEAAERSQDKLARSVAVRRKLEEDLQTLQAEYQAMRNRAKAAELTNTQLSKASSTRLQAEQEVQQYIEEENSQLKGDNDTFRQRAEAAEIAAHSARAEVERLQTLLETANEQFEAQLASEQKARAEAEHRVKQLKSGNIDWTPVKPQETPVASHQPRMVPVAKAAFREIEATPKNHWPLLLALLTVALISIGAAIYFTDIFGSTAEPIRQSLIKKTEPVQTVRQEPIPVPVQDSLELAHVSNTAEIVDAPSYEGSREEAEERVRQAAEQEFNRLKASAGEN